MLAIATWNATQFLATVTPGLAWSVYWARLHFVGQPLVVPAIFALVLEYAGREDLLTRRTVALLLVEPVVVNLLLWTNGSHDLFIRYAAVDAAAEPSETYSGMSAARASHPRSATGCSMPATPRARRVGPASRSPAWTC